MNFSITDFISKYVERYGAMEPRKEANLNILLAFMRNDQTITDMRHMAYMLATVKHECADTWEPVEEIGRGHGKKYGKPDPITGQTYFGRGYVQITWADNYKRIGEAIGVDLYRQPEKALRYDTAYKIMSEGMRRGLFTGVKMIRYLHDDVTDYINTRRVINGTDCAEKIAKYAVDLESIVKECRHE